MFQANRNREKERAAKGGGTFFFKSNSFWNSYKLAEMKKGVFVDC
ncbi:hypothetical protein SD77_1084 [Bacillus badius]|uniref:Ribose 5-phosphate isomerase B n=1 Tax=Bacillus badius TaxID=1455 RepID=A0ABR5ASP0_BACBA|nr:hypothetical protein SD78_2692 [Bacillus badius]KIL77755.1 hypothetical protein SD77_1084 [Bacillus badius]